jgi:hypothetical protein
MARAEKPVETERDKNRGYAPFQNVHREKMLDEAQRKNCKSDRGGVSERNRDEGAEDCRAALFLQAQGQRKQPAHGWIQTVVCAEKHQGNPRPVVIHYQF